MPAAVVAPAAIGAAGALGSALIGSRSSSNAAKAQQRSTTAALDFEREREMYNRQERERARADYERLWNAWQSQRLGWMKRYGMNTGQPTQPRLTLGALSNRPQGGF